MNAITVKLPEADYARLEDHAAKSGLSVNEYARKLLSCNAVDRSEGRGSSLRRLRELRGMTPMQLESSTDILRAGRDCGYSDA